jgi:hypothetical protein
MALCDRLEAGLAADAAIRRRYATRSSPRRSRPILRDNRTRLTSRLLYVSTKTINNIC